MRETIKDSHEYLQARLLRNFGELILSMLGCKLLNL